MLKLKIRNLTKFKNYNNNITIEKLNFLIFNIKIIFNYL